MENKRKHLDMIQGVINRMAQDSFMLKGWTVTLVAGLLALSTAISERIGVITISYLPVIMFWILDAYYLWQERLFRAVYDAVRVKAEAGIDFAMNPQDHINDDRTWVRSFLSLTIWPFYLSLLIAMSAVIVFLISSKGVEAC